MVPYPTEPGFYKYVSGGQTMIFVLTHGGQWRVVSDSGSISDCHWSYIEQGLDAWDGLEKIE